MLNQIDMDICTISTVLVFDSDQWIICDSTWILNIKAWRTITIMLNICLILLDLQLLWSCLRSPVAVRWITNLFLVCTLCARHYIPPRAVAWRGRFRSGIGCSSEYLGMGCTQFGFLWTKNAKPPWLSEVSSPQSWIKIWSNATVEDSGHSGLRLACAEHESGLFWNHDQHST